MSSSTFWSHRICGCFDNCGICMISWLVPCYQFGKNAEAVGDSCCCCCCCYMCPILGCLFHCSNRQKIREIRGIYGGCVSDALFTLCCPCCALAQEAQEILQMRISPGVTNVQHSTVYIERNWEDKFGAFRLVDTSIRTALNQLYNCRGVDYYHIIW